MEKILRYLIAAIVAFVPAVVSLSSCSDKDGDEKVINAEVIKEKAVGVWKMTSSTGSQSNVTIFLRFGSFGHSEEWPQNFDYFYAAETSSGYEYLDLTTWGGAKTVWGIGTSTSNSTCITTAIGANFTHAIQTDFIVSSISSKEMTVRVQPTGSEKPLVLSGSGTYKKSSEKEMQDFRQKVISSGTNMLTKE